MRYSNCLFYAAWLWLTQGGYVIMRKSRYGWWPHFMWAESLGELVITEYTPHKKVLLTDRLHVPPPVFKGYVRRGTDGP